MLGPIRGQLLWALCQFHIGFVLKLSTDLCGTIKSNYLSWLRRCGALNAFFTLDIWLGAHFLSSSLPAWKPPPRAPPTCNYVAARHTHTGTHTDTQLQTQLHTGTAGWRALNSWHTIFNTKYMYAIYTYIVAIVSDVVSIYIYFCAVWSWGAQMYF